MNTSHGYRVGFFGINAGDEGVGNEFIIPPGTLFHVDLNMGAIDPNMTQERINRMSSLRVEDVDMKDRQARLRNVAVRQIGADGKPINIKVKPTTKQEKPLSDQQKRDKLQAITEQLPANAKTATKYDPTSQTQPKSGILARLFNLFQK
jgi:hypothetical protein